MKKTLLLILLVAIVVSNLFFANDTAKNERLQMQRFDTIMDYVVGSGNYFKLNTVTDSVLLALGAGLLVSSAAIGNTKTETFNDSDFNRDDINQFDRWAMQPYSKPLDITADVGMVSALAMSAASLIPLAMSYDGRKELVTAGVIFAETFMIAQGTKDIIKNFVFRARPYSYFEDAPQQDIDSGDWNCSFPSGHSALSFAGASCASILFCSYFPDSAWRVPVIAASCGIAVATASLRVASGNHFFSDVLAGAAIGSAIGVGVPLLHKIGVSKKSDKNEIVVPLVNGVAFNFKF